MNFSFERIVRVSCPGILTFALCGRQKFSVRVFASRDYRNEFVEFVEK